MMMISRNITKQTTLISKFKRINFNNIKFTTTSLFINKPSTSTTTTISINNDNNNNIIYNNRINRFYSSNVNTAPISDINTFHELVDGELDLFLEKLEILMDANTVEGFDVEGSDGVLTINTGSNGTYVINKQTPNRQIWWSSPVSGPKRFDYNSLNKQWVDNVDGTPLRKLLNSEINTLCKYDMKI